jgi:adenylate cyclase
VELIGLAADPSAEAGAGWTSFAAGLALYRDRAWKQAVERFEACLAVWPDDGPARFYIALCQRYAEHPPEGPWHGVVRMDTK